MFGAPLSPPGSWSGKGASSWENFEGSRGESAAALSMATLVCTHVQPIALVAKKKRSQYAEYIYKLAIISDPSRNTAICIELGFVVLGFALAQQEGTRRHAHCVAHTWWVLVADNRPDEDRQRHLA